MDEGVVVLFHPYDASEDVTELVDGLLEAAPNSSLFLVDGSQSRTDQLVHRVESIHHAVRIHRRPRTMRLASAYLKAFSSARKVLANAPWSALGAMTLHLLKLNFAMALPHSPHRAPVRLRVLTPPIRVVRDTPCGPILAHPWRVTNAPPGAPR